MAIRRQYWLIPAIALQVLLMAAIGCTQESVETNKNRHRERAIQYFDKGEYREALVELRNVVKLDPKDADAHYRQALAHLKLGTTPDVQQAFKELSTAVELNPDIQDAQLKLGQLLLLSREPGKAREHADVVLAKAPDNKEGVFLRGSSLINEQKFEEGIAELKRAAALDPQNVNIYLDLARAYVHLKDYASAESTLQDALKANPKSLESRFALGDLHQIRGKSDLAETEYKRAVQEAPDRSEPYLKLGNFYISTNRISDAEATYSDWAKAKPQDDSPLVTLGDFYRFTGRADQALESYQKARTMNPKSTATRDRIVSLYIDTNKLDQAEQQTKAILETNKMDPSGRLFDARLKLARGQVDDALAVLQPLSREGLSTSEPHHFLGMAYAAKGDLPQAVQALNDALKLAPNSIESRTALAAVHLNQGSPDLAIEQAQAALRLNPRNMRATTLLGEAYLRKGDTEKGKQVFTAIVKAVPVHVYAHNRLGLIARAERKDAEALSHFEDALKGNRNSVEALAQIVSIKIAQGKPAEARDRLIQHRDLIPKNPFVHILLGRLYASGRQFDQAESSFKHALELNDGVLDAYTGLAEVYMRTNRMDQAVTEYKAALSKNPKLVPAIMILGMIAESKKDFAEAQTRYEEVLKVNPRFGPAANNLAWLIMERGGNSDVALKHAQTAREELPNDPNIADTLGWIYYQKNVYLQAAVLLKEATEKLPDDPIVQYHYGMAQYKSGNKSEAVKALERSLKLKADHPGAAEAKATLTALSSSK